MGVLGSLASGMAQQRAERQLEDYYMRYARTHAAFVYARNWLRGKHMVQFSDKKHEGLPVAGYKPQSDEAVQIVNGFKAAEERILRQLDALKSSKDIDQRWLAIGRTNLEQAFMAINRSVFAPTRVALDGDGDAQ